MQAVLTSRAEAKCASLLDKAAARAQLEYLRGGEAFDDLVDDLRDEHHLAYCAVIGRDGRFVAHTDPTLVATMAPARPEQPLPGGDVQAIEYAASNGQPLFELRAPLVADSQPIGHMCIATHAPDVRATLRDLADAAPPVVLVPLALVGVGALLLHNMTMPLAGIEQQLQLIGGRPRTAPIECHRLPNSSVLHVGWNRVVDTLQRTLHEAASQSLTERVAAAIEGRKQHDSLHILDHLSEGMAVTDAEGRITFANRALAALLGETGHGDDAKGCPIYEYLRGHVDDPAALDEVHHANHERAARAEVVRSRGDRKRVLRVERQPIAAGESGHVWSLRDVTQQKLAEEMRGQFIDSATHELRTPLANIRAYSETLALMEGVDIEQQKEFCNTINSEATRLARFVDDLLSVSSMEVGSLSINRQNVNLQRLFDEVVDKVRPLTVKKSQEFGVELPEKLGDAYLDKDKTVAMLVNLLGNASKYTPASGRIAMVVHSGDGLLTVNIEDSGVGIAPEELPRIFDKFFRSKDPRVQSETGTGLGLSLANEIVRLHGGQLTVKSTLEKGSTFTVCIPLMQEARL